MSWILTVVIGFLNALFTAFAVGCFGLLYVEWFRVSSREGGSGYLVIFMGLCGLVLGLISGIVCARIIAGGDAPTFLKGIGLSAGVSLALVAVATLVAWLVADLDPKLHGNPVLLHAEVRTSVGFVIPPDIEVNEWYAHIDTHQRSSTSYSQLRLKDARQEEGRWIIPITFELGTSVREKFLYVRFGEKNLQLFVPVFPAKPDASFFSWSEWLNAGVEAGKTRPEPADRFTLRFRLEEKKPEEAPAPVPPSGPADPDPQLTQEKADIEALIKLTPESPFEECMKFTTYTYPEAIRRPAGVLIGQRPNVVAELTAEIFSSDDARYDRALRALEFVKPLPASLAEPVAAMGEKVVAAIERFNGSTPAEDPHYQGAADASLLFSSWFQGHRALHTFAGVDGVPQLKKILALAEKRTDSEVMKDDVVRIARHYIREWSEAPAAAK